MQNHFLHRLSQLLLLKHPRDLESLLAGLERISGDGEKVERLLESNEKIFSQRVAQLGLKKDSSPERIYAVLLKQMALAEDEFTFLVNGRNKGEVAERSVKKMVRLAKMVHPETRGFFLKKEKAKEVLRNYPPDNLLKRLGYKNTAELLAKEDIFEIFAALRFAQDGKWMSGLLEQYGKFKPADFERRAIKTLVLDEKKWYPIAKEFIKKKYHNLSHSKEMGVIFLVPTPGQFQGLHLRAFALLLHYFWEVTFYSRLFLWQAKNNSAGFGRELVVAITGDVPDGKSKYNHTFCWHILQRYLAKDPKKDWRFYEPHIMPEALHWRRALGSLVRLQKKYPRLLSHLGFWDHDMDWIAKIFKTSKKTKILTLNFEDLLFSYAQNLPFEKYYLYHWRESLWNKLFSIYIGEKKMEELMLQNLSSGRVCKI